MKCDCDGKMQKSDQFDNIMTSIMMVKCRRLTLTLLVFISESCSFENTVAWPIQTPLLLGPKIYPDVSQYMPTR